MFSLLCGHSNVLSDNNNSGAERLKNRMAGNWKKGEYRVGVGAPGCGLGGGCGVFKKKFKACFIYKPKKFDVARLVYCFYIHIY